MADELEQIYHPGQKPSPMVCRVMARFWRRWAVVHPEQAAKAARLAVKWDEAAAQ
jgi:hypothetical protein